MERDEALRVETGPHCNPSHREEAGWFLRFNGCHKTGGAKPLRGGSEGAPRLAGGNDFTCRISEFLDDDGSAGSSILAPAQYSTVPVCTVQN